MAGSQSQQELAYALLVLEKQLLAYRKLHEEELQALFEELSELKNRILGSSTTQVHPYSRSDKRRTVASKDTPSEHPDKSAEPCPAKSDRPRKEAKKYGRIKTHA